MPKRKSHKIPPAGTTFEATYKDKKYRMVVVSADGSPGYKVGTSVFSSPSAAAKSITKREVNGWLFWGMEADT